MNVILEKLKEYSSILHMPRNSGEFADMFKKIMPSFPTLSQYVAKKATTEEKKQIYNILKTFVDSLLTKLVIPNTDQFLQRYDMSLTSPETYITYMITTLSYFHGLACYIKKELDDLENESTKDKGKEKQNYKFIKQSGCFGGSDDINKPIENYTLTEIVQAIMCLAAKWQNLVLRDWWITTEEGTERTRELIKYLMNLLYRSMELCVLQDPIGTIIDYEPYRKITNQTFICNVHMRRYTMCCLCRMMFICNFFLKESRFSQYNNNQQQQQPAQTEKEKKKGIKERTDRIRNLLITEAIGLLDMSGYVDKMRIEITDAALRLGAIEDFTATRNMQSLIPASIVNISFLPDAQMHMVNVDDETLREYLMESRSVYDERNIDFLWYAVPRLHQLYMDNIYLQALESLFTKHGQSFSFRGECQVYEDGFFTHYQLLSSMDIDRPIIFNMFDRMYILFRGQIFFTTSIFDAIYIWSNIVERYCSAIVLNMSVRETISMLLRGVISRQELSFEINYKDTGKYEYNEDKEYDDDDDDGKQNQKEEEEEEEEEENEVYSEQINFLKKCIWGKDYDTLKELELKRNKNKNKNMNINKK
jgi:hypothetical protein